MATKNKRKPAAPKAPEPESEGYNGWANYETWAVALHIDNTESTHNQRRRMATSAWEYAECDSWTRSETARFRFEDTLRDWITEMAPDLGATLWADLLGAAFDEVDWREIAQSIHADNPELFEREWPEAYSL